MDKIQSAVYTFNDLAEVYEARFMDQSAFHDGFEVFCAHLPKTAPRLLDVACGPGNITQYLLKKCPDAQVLGIDLAPRMLTLAAQNNPQARFQELDAREIYTLQGPFEGIMCGFCLPYLSKEATEKLISDAAGLLAPNGIAYFSTMEDLYEKSGLESSSDGKYQTWTYYHEEQYLRRFMENSGFEIIFFKKQAYHKPDGRVMTDLILVGRLTHHNNFFR